MYCSIIYIVHCRYEDYLNYRVATRQKRISSVSSINLLFSLSLSLSRSLQMKYVAKQFLFWYAVHVYVFTVTHIHGDLFPHLQILHRSCQTPFLHKGHYPVCFPLGCRHNIFYISFVLLLSAYNLKLLGNVILYGNCFLSKLYWLLYFLGKNNLRYIFATQETQV